MKKEIVGIVVEFNPLHNGHKRLIDIVKEENPNAIVLAAMSGQFVQRGELSIFDKWTRAESAIENGVDIVVEIPPFFVLNNANIFAKKAMDIFNKHNVDKVYFGSESLGVDEIEVIVDKIIKEPRELERLKKEHHSLPRAFESFIGKELKANDTLGICYVLEAKKQGYNFNFNRVLRESNSTWSSASSIRKDLWSGMHNDKSLVDSNVIRNLDDYSDIIIGKLVTTNSDNNVIKYIKNVLAESKFDKLSSLIEASHNKSFTKAKLRREIMKFTLELEGSDEEIILATNDSGKDLLRDNQEYSFRHTKDNIDNYKVESFISLKSETTLEMELSKKMIIK